jgi:hypothetical protein
MTVDALASHLKKHWPAIRAQLLDGTYAASPLSMNYASAAPSSGALTLKNATPSGGGPGWRGSCCRWRRRATAMTAMQASYLFRSGCASNIH